MDRIAIIGCGGSGKTYLANRLAALLYLPLTHLDGVYYDADWKPLPQEEFAAIQRDLVAAQRWLIEGNYAGTLPIRLAACDTVIFLDLPAIACLVGIAWRRLRYRGGQHAQDGVYDRLTWSFIRYIWGYRETMRPRVRQLLTEHGGNVRLITLNSRRQATGSSPNSKRSPPPGPDRCQRGERVTVRTGEFDPVLRRQVDPFGAALSVAGR